MTTIHNVTQGSPEWHALRARYFTASEAAAMMGCSPYETRSALLRRKATGLVPDVDAATQRRFDDGHRAEAAMRPVAEAMIGEELFPATITTEVDGIKLLASMDGLTMTGDIGWENKLRNASTIAHIEQHGEPPIHHVWQLEQQMLVSGADRILFTCGDESEPPAHCWYTSKPERRKALIEGWKQFQRDLQDPEITNFRPEPEPVQAKPVEGFGTLVLRVEGRVVASNLDAFRAGADAFLARLPKPSDLKDDQDFADAEAAAKACSDAEARIKAAKEQAIAQMADVEAVLRTADTVSESIRQARLALEKAVKARKEELRAQIVCQAMEKYGEHIEKLSARVGFHVNTPMHKLVGVAKGKRSLASIQDAVDTELARAKIVANEIADQMESNIKTLKGEAHDWGFLFPDLASVAGKPAEDFANLLAARIATHKQAEEQRRQREEHAERQRKIAEAQRLREQEIKGGGAGCAFVPGGGAAAPAGYPMAAAATSAANAGNGPLTRGAGSIPATPHLTIGQINAAIHPLRIDEAGLAELGIAMPVTRDGLKRVVEALITHLTACMDAAVF
jgi:putative phage-type endonuclease